MIIEPVRGNNSSFSNFQNTLCRVGQNRVVKIALAAITGAAAGSAAGFLFGANPIAIATGALIGAISGVASIIFVTRRQIVAPVVTPTQALPVSKERLITAFQKLMSYANDNQGLIESADGVFIGNRSKADSLQPLINYLIIPGNTLENFTQDYTCVEILNVMEIIVEKLNLFCGEKREAFYEQIKSNTNDFNPKRMLDPTLLRPLVINIIKQLTHDEQLILQQYIWLKEISLHGTSKTKPSIDDASRMVRHTLFMGDGSDDEEYFRGLAPDYIHEGQRAIQLLIEDHQSIFSAVKHQ